MKNKTIKAIAVSALAILGQAQAIAQSSNTLFFDQYNYRAHIVNPANKFYGKMYIGIPVISNLSLSGGNSDFVFTDIIQNVNVNGQTKSVLFCDKNSPNGISNFLDALHGNERAFASFRTDIIDFGFKTEKAFLTFNIATRLEAFASVPNEVLSLPYEGVDEGQTYDLGVDNLALRANAFTEFSFGYSRDFTDKLTLGAHVKYLYGHAGIKSKFANLKVQTSEDEWSITGDGAIYAAVPGMTITEDAEGKIDELDFDSDDAEWGSPNGNGFAVDLGANYQLLPNLKLSASMLDFGLIAWSKSLNSVEKYDDFVYNGVEYDFTEDNGDYFDEYEDAFENSFKNGGEQKYTSFLTPKINIGAEYSFWENRLGLGLLSKTYLMRSGVWEEMMATANFRPWKRFSASLTYSIFDREWNNIGAGINMVLGAFNIYVACDNIPLKFAKSDNAYIPSNLRYARVNVGLGISIKGRDKKDKIDEDESEYVEEVAAPQPEPEPVVVDSDNDGVVDSLDVCGDTPSGVAVDEKGCPLDSDNDGVADYLDKCSDTPNGVVVDANGCPLDSDNDGVADYLDKCADTPNGVAVDQNGCPVDTDQDGVPDYLDKCPDTYGTVNGCPEIKQEVKQIFKKALNGIQFESGKSTLKSTSYPILNQIVNVMKENPTYRLTISGYTDNSGVAEKNLQLSKDRANAVKDYLVAKGVEADRLTAEGYGDANPIADNKTPQGRAKNRRVEFEAQY